MRGTTNRSLKLLLAAAMVISASTELKAQEALPEVWTLQQCLDYALANNLELKQKENAVTQSEIEIEAAEGNLFPSLSFATNQNLSWRPWSRSYANITGGTLATTTSSVNYNGTYGLQAQWQVWNGGINHKRYSRSKLANKQSAIDEDITRLSIQQQIVQVYVQILYQTEAVNVNRQILESTKIQRDRAKVMYEVGSMSRADLAQMEAQVSQEEYNVTNAETQLAQYKLQLKTILEIIGNTGLEVEIPVIDDGKITAALPSADDVYAYAVNNRPETRYSRMGIDLADIDIDIAKRGYYPTLSLSAGINTSTSSGLDQSWYNQIKTNLNNSIGMTVSVPIYDGRQNATNVKKAEVSKENAKINLAMQEKQLYSDIEGYWLSAYNAQQQYISALKSAESMRESYELVSEQFAVGLKDIVDLTTGKNNLVQAEQQLLQSKYTAVLNRAILDFYNGQPIRL